MASIHQPMILGINGQAVMPRVDQNGLPVIRIVGAKEKPAPHSGGVNHSLGAESRSTRITVGVTWKEAATAA